jgi:hypothetical protein
MSESDFTLFSLAGSDKWFLGHADAEQIRTDVREWQNDEKANKILKRIKLVPDGQHTVVSLDETTSLMDVNEIKTPYRKLHEAVKEYSKGIQQLADLCFETAYPPRSAEGAEYGEEVQAGAQVSMRTRRLAFLSLTDAWGLGTNLVSEVLDLTESYREKSLEWRKAGYGQPPSLIEGTKVPQTLGDVDDQHLPTFNDAAIAIIRIAQEIKRADWAWYDDNYVFKTLHVLEDDLIGPLQSSIATVRENLGYDSDGTIPDLPEEGLISADQVEGFGNQLSGLASTFDRLKQHHGDLHRSIVRPATDEKIKQLWEVGRSLEERTGSKFDTLPVKTYEMLEYMLHRTLHPEQYPEKLSGEKARQLFDYRARRAAAKHGMDKGKGKCEGEGEDADVDESTIGATELAEMNLLDSEQGSIAYQDDGDVTNVDPNNLYSLLIPLSGETDEDAATRLQAFLELRGQLSGQRAGTSITSGAGSQSQSSKRGHGQGSSSSKPLTKKGKGRGIGIGIGSRSSTWPLQSTSAPKTRTRTRKTGNTIQEILARRVKRFAKDHAHAAEQEMGKDASLMRSEAIRESIKRGITSMKEKGYDWSGDQDGDRLTEEVLSGFGHWIQENDFKTIMGEQQTSKDQNNAMWRFLKEQLSKEPTRIPVARRTRSVGDLRSEGRPQRTDTASTADDLDDSLAKLEI